VKAASARPRCVARAEWQCGAGLARQPQARRCCTDTVIKIKMALVLIGEAVEPRLEVRRALAPATAERTLGHRKRRRSAALRRGTG